MREPYDMRPIVSGGIHVPGLTMTKQEQVYQFLRTRILSGEYGHGARLVADSLARELGVSTIPVREAIRRLEAEGLVQYTPHRGAVVTPVDEQLYLEVMSCLAVLEGYATRLAARHLGPSQLADLRQINEAMKRAIQEMDPLAVSRYNRAFHQTIWNSCNNRYLIERLREASARLDSVRQTLFVWVPGRAHESVVEHEAIVTAIERQASLDEIERLARGHKEQAIRAFLEWRKRHGEGMLGSMSLEG